MRKVRRRYTNWLCKPPWIVRPHKGRSILSNVKDPMFIQAPNGDVLETGVYDLLFRTYRHSGVSLSAVTDGDEIRYFMYEWTELVNRGCHWIEFNHPTNGSIFRIDMNTARKWGVVRQTENWGLMWAVPIWVYERGDE